MAQEISTAPVATSLANTDLIPGMVGNVFQAITVALLRGVSSQAGNQLTPGPDGKPYATGFALAAVVDALIPLIDGKVPLTTVAQPAANLADANFFQLLDGIAHKRATFGDIAAEINKRLTGDNVPEVVSLGGSEFMPLVVTNPVSGAKTVSKIKLDFMNAAADHRTPRRFKDRNYGPHATRVIDTLSDPTGVGSTYQFTAGQLGGAASRAISSEAIFGTQIATLVTGVRVAAAVTADYSIVRRNNIGRSLNLTGKWIRIDMETPDPLAIDEIQFFLGNNNLGNFFRWNNLLGDQATRPVQYGNRTRISFPLLVAPTGDPKLGQTGYNNSVTGTPDIADISSWQIRLLGKLGAQATLKIDRVAVVNGPAPAISITTDDGYESWYSVAKPILDRYGARSTLFAIRQYHDPLHPNYNPAVSGSAGFGYRFSEAQIASFIAGGHELAFHMTGNHAGQDFSPQEVENEIIAFKTWAKRVFDYDVMTGAYPGGENGYFVGPNYPAGHAQAGQAKPLWGQYYLSNKKPSGAAYASDSEVTIRDVFAKHLPFSRSIVLNNPETDPATDGSMLRCFFYQFGPSYVPSSGTRLGIKSAHPNYNGRPTITKNSGTLVAGGATSVTLAATASAVADDYKNHMVMTTGGTGAGQVRWVTGYTSGKVLTVDTAFSPALDTSTTYIVYQSKTQFMVESLKLRGGVGISSFHDVFPFTGYETLVLNEAPYTTSYAVPINPYNTGGSPLGTQASASDLEELCRAAQAADIDMMPMREAFTRSL